MSAESLTTLKSSALGCEHFSADTFLLLIISLLSYRNPAKRTMTDFFFFSFFNAEGLPIYFQ